MDYSIEMRKTAVTMSDRKLKYIFGLTASLLLIWLLIKIIKLPGGLILPGYFLGGMLLVGVLIVCVIITSLMKLIFKRNSFLALFTIVATVAFTTCHYYLYSPTLKIIVPKGYTGSVTLVLSNVQENMLRLDSNGIGYINKWTFEKTYTPPVVTDNEGNSLNEQLVGFNPSTFWANGYATSSEQSGRVAYISFEIVPRDKAGVKQYYSKDITNLVDRRLVLSTP